MADQRGPLIGRGRTADIFGWQDGQIVKLFHDLMSDTAIDEEIHAGQALAATGLPVPRLYDRITLDGRRGIVYERVEGPSMLAELQRQPWRAVRFARQLADLHAAIHAVRAETLPTQRDRLRWQIDHAAPLPDPLKAVARAALDRLPPGDRICHGDFHPDNILMTARGPVIIDWMTATRGHPLGDVARTVLLISIGAPIDSTPLWRRLLINRLRQVVLNTYLRRYRDLTGVTSAEIAAWTLPITAARLSEPIPQETARLLAQIEALAAQRA
jgi:aminoglycoside phosphotransferase (APT) family kinase protein